MEAGSSPQPKQNQNARGWLRKNEFRNLHRFHTRRTHNHSLKFPCLHRSQKELRKKNGSEEVNSEQMNSEEKWIPKKMDSKKMVPKKWLLKTGIPKTAIPEKKGSRRQGFENDECRKWIQKPGMPKKWRPRQDIHSQNTSCSLTWSLDLSLATRPYLIISSWNWPEAFDVCIGFFCLSYMHRFGSGIGRRPSIFALVSSASLTCIGSERRFDLVAASVLAASSHFLLLIRGWLHQCPKK